MGARDKAKKLFPDVNSSSQKANKLAFESVYEIRHQNEHKTNIEINYQTDYILI